MDNLQIYRSEKFTFQFAFGKGSAQIFDKSKIVNDLAKNMPGMDVKSYFNHQPDFFLEQDHVQIVIENSSNEVIAIFTTKWHNINENDMLQLVIFWVSLNHNGMFFISEMLGFQFHNILIREKIAPRYMFMKTYHPGAFRMFKSFKVNSEVDLFPIINEDNSNHSLSQLATNIAKRVTPNANLLVKTGVLKDGHSSVGTSFFSEQPKCSSETLNKFFSDNLTVKDQVLGVVDFRNHNNLLTCIKQFGKTHTKNLKLEDIINKPL